MRRGCGTAIPAFPGRAGAGRSNAPLSCRAWPRRPAPIPPRWCAGPASWFQSALPPEKRPLAHANSRHRPAPSPCSLKAPAGWFPAYRLRCSRRGAWNWLPRPDPDRAPAASSPGCAGMHGRAGQSWKSRIV